MNKSAKSVINGILKTDKGVNIKLLGDSITHGVGGSGFEQNGVPITAGFARNPDGYCWAKQFKEYMEKNYNCTVTNNACTGTNIQFVIEHFDELVEDTDDIVICTIGTNNRHRYFKDGPKPTHKEMSDGFYNNILTLSDKFKAKNKTVIFMANIPASGENEKDGEEYWRILHMDDINALYKKAAEVCSFPLISMYDMFSRYCAENKIVPDSLLADGLHPNDNGYDVMFKLLIKELEL